MMLPGRSSQARHRGGKRGQLSSRPQRQGFRRELHPSKRKGGQGHMSTVAVVGLGYVGLPLAVAFGKKFRTIGFDLSAEKVENYRRHVDPTGEVSSEEFRAAARLTVTTDPAQLAAADIIVVAGPTPVAALRQPDLDRWSVRAPRSANT